MLYVLKLDGKCDFELVDDLIDLVNDKKAVKKFKEELEFDNERVL